MAKKRGGIAGVWDRNKGIIKTLAPMALGAIPGVGIPLAAAAGAAMSGLDRPGKRGIGFDPMAGVQGGLAGAASGAAGAGIQKGIAGLFAPKTLPTAAASAGISSLPPLDTGRFANVAGITRTPGAPIPTPSPTTPAVGDVVREDTTPTPNQSKLRELLSGAKSNWELISGAGNAVNALLGQNAQQAQAEALLEQQRLQNERMMEEFRLKRQETETERENRRRLTQLLMPLLMQQFSNVLPPATQTPPPQAG